MPDVAGVAILKIFLIVCFSFSKIMVLFPSLFDLLVRVTISVVCEQQKYPLSVFRICHTNVITLI